MNDYIQQIKQTFFVNRVVKNWNTLPKTVVGAGSLNTFKNSLDRLWSNQDLLYNNHRAVIEKKDYILTGSSECIYDQPIVDLNLRAVLSISIYK